MQPQHPGIRKYSPVAIEEAAALILAGGIVAVPTETVYGLAADATNAGAVARIYAAKGRPSFNPLIVHVLDLAAAERIAEFGPNEEPTHICGSDNPRYLAEAFWPGPLTLVLPLRADAGIAALVTAGLATVAIRVPAGRAMRDLLEATGKPLAAPSANASGAISPTRAQHVAASLGEAVPLILDDGPTTAGLESTIFQHHRILRPGPVTATDIYKVLGRTPYQPFGGAITAPGQLLSHYAPSKPLRLNITTIASDEWLIGFGRVQGNDTLSADGDLNEAAANLFDALHRADASDKPRIAVAPIPETGVGAAINDRLRRAAHR